MSTSGKGRSDWRRFARSCAQENSTAIPKVLETPKKEDLKEDVENLKVLSGLLGEEVLNGIPGCSGSIHFAPVGRRFLPES